ncbi:helix-turn-helix domain-containing protein [Pantoea sp. S61]|uniref:GlxA family transcriptional regulator n=1 Tax=Pantoea sp. S61 TaxID=2767442 RepID=UPI00190D2C77|nr:helix-turn-helix domain-containing protein [Pantoea sp. S61]MBK0122501.1 helix-turn-helix domain-containing protein [Pantoea sp. S61]MBK0122790.1 helix-turn-helix domain-containing protein [Pantoea sp. S61]
MRIAILALEGSVLSAIAGLADLFWISNKAIASSPAHACKFSAAPFETLIVSADGAPVLDTEGRLIHIDSSFQGAGNLDVVIAPGMLLGPDLQPINIHNIRQAAGWVKELHEKNVCIAASGTGAVVLGEAGLLDDRHYSTTWWVSHMIKERYPSSQLSKGKMVEEDRGIVTSGGCFSWISLAMHLIEKGAGAEVANLTSEMSLNDNHLLRQSLNHSNVAAKSDSAFMIRAQEIIRLKNLSITAAELADALHTTERTLQRKLKTISQETPKEFITRVRIESACNMLVSTNVSIRKVAQDCGYSEDTAFRKAFNQVMDMSPIQYRQWMSARLSRQ